MTKSSMSHFSVHDEITKMINEILRMSDEITKWLNHCSVHDEIIKMTNEILRMLDKIT
jgi:hypothetical protein